MNGKNREGGGKRMGGEWVKFYAGKKKKKKGSRFIGEETKKRRKMKKAEKIAHEKKKYIYGEILSQRKIQMENGQKNKKKLVMEKYEKRENMERKGEIMKREEACEGMKRKQMKRELKEWKGKIKTISK